MTDPTEAARRELLPTMPDELRAVVARGERVWSTDELREEFDVEGFAAPFVVVRRRADGVRGSLEFTHRPRWYFNFEPTPEVS